MTNADRGRRTGQHEQPTQQAVMFRGCDEAMADIERERPATRLTLDGAVTGRHAGGTRADAAETVKAKVDATFCYGDRIEITRYTNLTPWQDAAAAALERQAAQDADDDAPANHCDFCGEPKTGLVCGCEEDTPEEREGIRRSDEDKEA